MRLSEYSMILWAEGTRDPEKLIRSVSGYLHTEFGEMFVPDKCDGKRIPSSTASLTQFIQRNTAKDSVFHVLLSSEDELRFSLTLDQPPELLLPEVMTLNFLRASVLSQAPPLSFRNLLALFQYAVNQFAPIWADFRDSEQSITDDLQQLRLRVDGRKTPYSIGWFNYFGPAMVKRMGGANKLLSAPVFLAEFDARSDGVLLILQEEPFDYYNMTHRAHQQTVENYLGLPELHEKYAR